MNSSKRKLIDQQELDVKYLHKLMRDLFPKKNDCAEVSEIEEVVQELKLFGISNKLQVRLFLKKHRRWLLKVDSEAMDIIHQNIFRQEIGDEEFSDSMRRQYWFCYPAFVRNAMEIEFGEKYEEFSSQRDKI